MTLRIVSFTVYGLPYKQRAQLTLHHPHFPSALSNHTHDSRMRDGVFHLDSSIVYFLFHIS